MKVILKVKDKNKINELKQYGHLVYTSPVLNIVGLNIAEEYLKAVKQDPNVLSCKIESKGNLMPV